MIKYKYMDSVGRIRVSTYSNINQALRSVARDHESSIRSPIELYYNNKSYNYQELMMLCHSYNYL